MIFSLQSVNHLFPFLVPLAVIILGRDVGLILASFVVRFISLPPPVSACTKQNKTEKNAV